MLKRLRKLWQSLDKVTFIKTILLVGIKNLTFRKARISFSQNGEDILLQSILNSNKNGFYVDVGCHFPVSRSNTFNLYLKGWRGVCVDANLTLVQDFRKVRRKDRVENFAVSNRKGELDFYEFQDPAIGTISKSQKKRMEGSKKISSVQKVRSIKLTKLLEDHKVPVDFDLLAIDAEGHDFEVLTSLNFDRYRPNIILIELGKQDNFNNIINTDITDFLVIRGYDFIAFDSMNAYYKRGTE